MPDINDKGVHVPIWAATLIVSSVFAVLGWLFVTQLAVTNQILTKLTKIEVDLNSSNIYQSYIIKRLDEYETELKELKKETQQQRREIDKLSR